MMPDYVKIDLSKETPTPFQNAILDHCRSLVNMSRSKMCKYYNKWDAFDLAYRGERFADKEDKKAREKGEPEKITIPVIYAQAQTFVAFIFSLYFQRERFFEMGGTGEEDELASDLAEATLDRDLVYNKWASKCYEFLLNIPRFGLGVVKHTWVHEKQMTWTKTEVPILPQDILGMSVSDGGTTEQIELVEGTKFLGNKLMVISPYRFFPDVRLPLTRHQEGEFCASEDEYSFADLKSMEARGEVSGIDFIPALSRSQNFDSTTTRYQFAEFGNAGRATLRGSSIRGSIVVTEVQIKLIPKKFMVNGKPLGEEDYPIKYVVWYANNERVIKCEPMGYLHDNFTYVVAQMSPDQHRLVNEGLSDLCDQLQSVMNWFVNARVASVRRIIRDQLIVDPQGIDIADLKNRNSIIKLKPAAARSGVDKWIKQLELKDVTAGHLQDVSVLQGMIQLITGINENLLGQFHQGRRSASEARAVQAGTANRLQMIANLIWVDAMEPLGRMMLSNLRDGLDEPALVQITGQNQNLSADRQFMEVDKTKLIGNYDFQFFDGTLPSEKATMAQALQDLLSELISNPQGIPILGFDPRKIMLEIGKLRGIRQPERFLLDQARMQLAQQGLVSAGLTPPPQQGLPPNAQPNQTVGPGPVQPGLPQPNNQPGPALPGIGAALGGMLGGGQAG